GAIGVAVLLGAAWVIPARAAATPTIAITDTTVAEGGTAIFVVSLSAASTATVTVHYATADGSAVAGRDYKATSGTLTFAPGETSKTVTVRTRRDPVPGDKVFYVQLSGPTNATIADPLGIATITDNSVTVAVSDVSVAEPQVGSIKALFQVNL